MQRYGELHTVRVDVGGEQNAVTINRKLYNTQSPTPLGRAGRRIIVKRKAGNLEKRVGERGGEKEVFVDHVQRVELSSLFMLSFLRRVHLFVSAFVVTNSVLLH